MPVIRMSYLDLSPEQRKSGAKPVKERIKASLSQPDLAPDQMKQLHERLMKIEKWEKGVLERPAAHDNPPPVEEKKISPQFVQKLKDLHTPKS